MAMRTWAILAILTLPFLGCAKKQPPATRVAGVTKAVMRPPTTGTVGRKDQADTGASDPRIFQTVKRGDVTATLVERGALEAAQSQVVICKVRNRGTNKVAGTIKWVIDDGSSVKKGDKLVELDDSALQEDLKKQRITVAEAEAALIQAGTTLEVAKLGTQHDLESAQAALETAESELVKYGEMEPRQRRKLEIKLGLAKQALEAATLHADKQPTPEAKLAVKRAEGEMEIAEIDLKNHVEATPGEKKQREVQLRQARSALEIVKLQTAGKEIQARAQQDAASAVLKAEEARLKNVQEDLKNCLITAPGDGLAVYVVPEQARFGSGSPLVVAQGEPVKEGQRLLHVTDLREMQVNTKVHEALVSRLRPAQGGKNGSPGQPALVRVDAYPNRPLVGNLRSVASVASPQDWLSADVKVYPAIVALNASLPGLKPGMSAEVTILLEERQNVLRIPVQAIVAEGKETSCYVKSADGVEKRKVTTGLSDNQYVEIKDGVREGEEVLVNPGPAQAGKKPRDPASGQKQSRGPGATDILVRSVKPAADAGDGRRSRVASYGLTYQDFERLQTIEAITRLVPLRSFPQEIRHLERKVTGRLVATRPEYAEVFAIKPAAGRFLTAEDDRQMKNVAVLGAAVAKDLFPQQDPLGQTVQLGEHFYVVVGVAPERIPVSQDKEAEDFNRDVYIPLQTCKVRFGEKVAVRQAGSFRVEMVELSQILLSVSAPGQVRPVAEVIANQLQQSHAQKDWDVQVTSDSAASR